MKKIIWLSLALSLMGCSKFETPILQYVPHMKNTWILKSQKGYEGNGNGASVMLPPEGAIPRGYTPYHYEDPEVAAAALSNPLPRTRQVLERGQKLFNVYCYVCHGTKGVGDGPVVPPYPIPKSLQSENVQRWKDGHIFHVITKGQGIMPSYAQQIQPQDRWAIIHYIRALQRAENPTDADLREYEKRLAK